MLSNGMILGIVIAVSTGVTVLTNLVIPLLKKKGITATNTLDVADTVLQESASVIKMIQGVAPSIPYLDLVATVIKLADIGVKKAEQLCKIGEINTKERKEDATAYVLDILKISKIEVTPDLQKVIDGAVQASVLALGHKDGKTDGKNIISKEHTVENIHALESQALKQIGDILKNLENSLNKNKNAI